MPRITQHKEDRIRQVIRDALAIDPLLSLKSIQDIVERKINRTVSLGYVHKMVRKANGAMAVVADREKVEDKIKNLRETNRIIRAELFRIAFPSDPSLIAFTKISERIRALEAIAKIEQVQAKLEMDFGLFTRHLGDLNIDHRLKPVEQGRLVTIIKAFESWGASPPQPRKIEAREMKTVESKNIPHEPNTTPNQPTATPTSPPTIIPVIGNNGLVLSE